MGKNKFISKSSAMTPLEQKIYRRNLVVSAQNYMRSGRPIPGKINRELAALLPDGWDVKNRVFVGEYEKRNVGCTNPDATLPINYSLFVSIENDIAAYNENERAWYDESPVKHRVRDAEAEYAKVIKFQISHSIPKPRIRKLKTAKTPTPAEPAPIIIPTTDTVIVSRNQTRDTVLLDGKALVLDIPLYEISVNIQLNGYALHLFGRSPEFEHSVSTIILSTGDKYENVKIIRAPVGQFAFKTKDEVLHDFTSRTKFHELARKTKKFEVAR